MSYMQKQAKASLPKTASVAACCPASVPAVGSHAGMTCHVIHAKAGKGKLTQNCIHGSLLPSFQTSSCFPCWYNNGSTTSDHLQQLLVMLWHAQTAADQKIDVQGQYHLQLVTQTDRWRVRVQSALTETLRLLLTRKLTSKGSTICSCSHRQAGGKFMYRVH